MTEIQSAIMIGGAGTRLWPLSRENRPKQFLRLFGERSLFQDTVLRFAAPGFAAPWLLSNAETLRHATAQLSEIGRTPRGVVVEPAMRGTAAALAALALIIARRDEDAVVLAAPSDHLIADAGAFRETVLRGLPLAEDGRVVTFGIVPTGPETGFGYIRPGEPIAAGGHLLGHAVATGGFVEKPPREKAERLIAAGGLWNAGIFLFKAAAFLAEVERHAPATLAAVREAAEAAAGDGSAWFLDASAFGRAPPDLSVDHAVMEKTDKVAVVPCDVGWSDVGSLSALWELREKDRDNNVLAGDALAVGSTGTLVHASGGRKVVAARLRDMLVVDTEDCVLVMPRDAAQGVRDVVAELRRLGAPELNRTRDAETGWGRVRLLDEGARHFCVGLELRPGAALAERVTSLGGETWTVTDGALELRRRDGNVVLKAGESLQLRGGEVVGIAAEDTASAVAVIAGRRDTPLDGLFAAAAAGDAEPGATQPAFPATGAGGAA